MLLVNKYMPKKLEELAGNEDAIAKVRQWILNWLRKERKRPLLINGPSGIGKTAVAYALKQEFDLELIEMNTSDLRNKSNIERVFEGALGSGSLFGKTKLLLIDDVDSLQRADHGGASAIAKVLKENTQPIIVTAVNPWEKNLAAIRMECELINMKKVNKSSVTKVLSKIVKAEGLAIIESRLDEIVASCDGDVRSAINDLQANNPSVRDREKDIFERVRLVFKATNYAEARKATENDFDYNLLKLWVDENICSEYESAEDIERAYSILSRADIFEGRIRGSTWGYLKYCIDLTTFGVALAKKSVYRKFTKYNYPNYLREMGKSIVRRAMLKSIGLKIGLKIHSNRKDALDYLVIIREQIKKNAELIKEMYGFEEEELVFIGSL